MSRTPLATSARTSPSRVERSGSSRRTASGPAVHREQRQADRVVVAARPLHLDEQELLEELVVGEAGRVRRDLARPASGPGFGLGREPRQRTEEADHRGAGHGRPASRRPAGGRPARPPRPPGGPRGARDRRCAAPRRRASPRGWRAGRPRPRSGAGSTPSSPPAGAATCTSRSVPRGAAGGRPPGVGWCRGGGCVGPWPDRDATIPARADAADRPRPDRHHRRGLRRQRRDGSAPSPSGPGRGRRGWWSSRSWPSAATRPATSSTCPEFVDRAPRRARRAGPAGRVVARHRGGGRLPRGRAGRPAARALQLGRARRGGARRGGGAQVAPAHLRRLRRDPLLPAVVVEHVGPRRGRWGSCSASRSARTSGTTSASGTGPATLATPSPTWWRGGAAWSSTSRPRPTRSGSPRSASGCWRPRPRATASPSPT